MTEYICQEVRTDNGGYLEPVKELIRCKDCDHHYGRTRCDIHLGLWFEDNYCDSSKRKEEWD